VSGRGGSGSFGSGRTAGYAIGEDRTSPWLEAIAGIRQRSCPRLGSKPVPAPRTRYEVRASLRRVLTAATATSTPFRAPVSVCGAGCAGEFSGQVLGVSFLVLSSWVCLVLSWVLSSFLGSWCAVGRHRKDVRGKGHGSWGQFLGSLVLISWVLGVHGSWVCLVLSWVLSSFLGSWWWWRWWRWRRWWWWWWWWWW
jgi:hypothetical protein